VNPASRSTRGVHPTPFFSAPGPGHDRRLLLISPHFPPSQAAGALRWQKFAPHAGNRGWGLDVVTLSPGALHSSDPSRMKSLPAGTTVFGVAPRRHPSDSISALIRSVARLRRRLRARAEGVSGPPPGSGLEQSIGRAEATFRWTRPSDVLRAFNAWREYAKEEQWAKDAARLACRLYRPGVHQAVVTCGPPHMVHLAGASVHRNVGLPFIMDLRDPWSLVQRLPGSIASALWWRLAARHERQVLEQAALVVANTEPLREAMQREYPGAGERIIAVLNGYDDDPLPEAHHGDRFIVAYAGTIYLDRNPRPLFQAAARVIDELDLAPHEFGIEFMGTVREYNRMSIASIASDLGIAPYVRVLPPGTRAEALDFLAQAAMLVSLPQDSDLAIPSKLFEFIRLDAWLLVMAELDSASERLVRGTGATVVSASDLDGIAEALRSRVLEYRAGHRPGPVGVDPVFSRQQQAGTLFDAIDRVAMGTADPADAGLEAQS
jgi:glycosyltransferase involved in cell wall biosynthesis